MRISIFFSNSCIKRCLQNTQEKWILRKNCILKCIKVLLTFNSIFPLIFWNAIIQLQGWEVKETKLVQLVYFHNYLKSRIRKKFKAWNLSAKTTFWLWGRSRKGQHSLLPVPETEGEKIEKKKNPEGKRRRGRRNLKNSTSQSSEIPRRKQQEKGSFQENHSLENF